MVRTFDILDALAAEQLSIGEISTRVGIPKTTTYRLLVTLERRGLVMRSGADAAFRLGPRLLHLGMHAEIVTDLREVALPTMRALRDRFGETTNLNALVGDERLCIASIEGFHEMRSVGVVGQRSPLHSGAAARAILAFLPDARIRAYLESAALEKLTDRTISSPAHLWRAVRQARRLGFVVTSGERTVGVMSVGAPIWNAYGEVIGSVNVAGPAIRMSTYPTRDLTAAVVDASRVTSSALGYIPMMSRQKSRSLRKGGA